MNLIKISVYFITCNSPRVQQFNLFIIFYIHPFLCS